VQTSDVDEVDIKRGASLNPAILSRITERSAYKEVGTGLARRILKEAGL
jgi:hypothetical protein